MQEFKDLKIINEEENKRFIILKHNIPNEKCIIKKDNKSYSISFILNNIKEAKHLKFKNLGLIDNKSAYLYGIILKVEEPNALFSIDLRIFFGLVYINKISNNIFDKFKYACNLIYLKQKVAPSYKDIGLSEDNRGFKYFIKEPLTKCVIKYKQKSYNIKYVFKNNFDAQIIGFLKIGITDDKKAYLYSIQLRGFKYAFALVYF